jgi:hypothetical protein
LKSYFCQVIFHKIKFKEARINQPPKTWEELREYSKRLTIDKNRDGRNEQYGLGVSPELSRQYFMMTALGGSLIDQRGNAAFSNSKSLKGLQLIIDQYRKDKSSAAVLMIHSQITLIPSYLILKNLGWLNSYQGLIVPNVVNATFIFMMRQFFINFPKELEEAAALDGLSRMEIFSQLFCP